MPADLQVIRRTKDRAAEKRYLENVFVIASFPRSGSHWTRRMMAETTKTRSGFKSAAFGAPLNQVSGFSPPVMNHAQTHQWETPFFVATHNLDEHPEKFIRVYLRRNFPDVLRSTRKAEQELPSCWWGGTDEEIYKKWSRHIARGCTAADVVIDYEVTKTNPATTVRLIGNLSGLHLTNPEITAAVDAGRRQNMLQEQRQCVNREWDIVNKENYYAGC